MQAWFSQLNTRAQMVTVSAVGGVLLMVLGFGVWLPLHQQLAVSKTQYTQSGQSLLAMQNLVSSFQKLAVVDGATNNYPSLTALVNQSLQGKLFQPASMQLNGGGELVLRVDNVAFQQALEWLSELENTRGLVLSTVTVNQVQGGLINITLTLHGL